MHHRQGLRRVAAAAVLASLALALSGCLLSPGKFASRLELRKGGTFAYSYDGQIHLLALSKLAEMGAKAEGADETFVEQPCYDDDTFEDRACTGEEIAAQKQDWEAGTESRKKEREKEAEMMRAMLGGIDPADPEAARELAERLRRQAGWSKVDYKGDGLFEVSFAISAPLGHDFVFPTIERFPMSNVFVQLALRDGGTVRVDAPGFAVQAAGNPFGGMMGGMAGAFAASEAGENLPAIPELDGVFTIVTDGRILANNTDEGPRVTAEGQVLEWKVNKRTAAAPTALIELAP